jgi:glycopeptide antibiotics resistance protein
VPVRVPSSTAPYGACVNELLRPALVGIAGGLGVFAVILLPSMWLQRRRFGRVRPARLAGVAVLCVYTMSLAGLTIAPAYDVSTTCRSRSGGVANVDPFQTAAEVLGMQRGGAGLLELATSFPVLQIVMNLALFLPLGLILRGVFRQDTTTSVALAVLLSALIELTQFTGAFGLYPCGVRIADIEDLLANALGAWAGALLAPLLTRWRVPLFAREERRRDAARGSSGTDEVEDLFRRES